MTDRTVDEVIRIAGTGIGKWWPNPWWPGGNSTFNDCAAFVSWALYGLNGNKPIYTYVPYIMDRAIREGRWTGGKALTPRPQTRTNSDGIRRGDIVIFDWRFRGSRDHVGIALQEPRNGGILTRQANNGGGGMGNAYTNDPAADVNYPTQFVLGYYRPAYKTTTTSGGNTSPITEEEVDMIPIRLDRKHIFTLARGQIAHQANQPMSTFVRNVHAADDVFVEVDQNHMRALLDSVGVPQDKVNYGNGHVFNPESERFEAGGMWNWERQLRKDVETSMNRNVSETSAAFHQLVAVITKGGNTRDASAIATELNNLLGPALAGQVVRELGKQLTN